MKKMFQILKLKAWSKNLLFLALGLLIAGGITVSAALSWSAEWTNVATGQILSVQMLKDIRDKVTQTYNEMSAIRTNADCGVNQVSTGINDDGTMKCINATSFSDITCDWVGYDGTLNAPYSPDSGCGSSTSYYLKTYCEGGKIKWITRQSYVWYFTCG